ncbi:PALP-domain-containing protein [Amniculicola lignicola CBS 123094]|uniref:Cysteine synthase 2 n=1 Tax=Amniculicola lignicola CBS 123094 TaxID=1392246 RepID=A0A6A5WU90_9PLEO|nr:PALP-domain-containing protein [Amniculicola lignicola CBS 123094]
MPDQAHFYVLGAFLLGVTLTVAWENRHWRHETLNGTPNKAWGKSRKRRAHIRQKESQGLLDKAIESVESLEEEKDDIREGIEGCIGNTPLIKIKSLSDATGCEILAKAEFLNGAGNSPKDRVALSIIQMAEERGLLIPHSGDTIYEGTVGSTGISLAAICQARGYKAHICMPNDMAVEKSDLLLKLGAEVERVRPAPIVDQDQFVNLASRRAIEHTTNANKPGRGLFADQFETEANWRAHYSGTGPEIYGQTGGHLDAFVSGAGTGGTLSGVALYLKPKLPNLKVVLADPPGSGLYNRVKFGVMFNNKEKEGTRRRHQVDTIIEGIGINRVTHNFDVGRELIDDAIRVTDDQAIGMAKWLVENDGIFVGSSSAVNCVAATKLAKQLGPGHRIVTLLCDSGARHLSKFWASTEPVGGAEGDISLDAILESRS